MQSRCEADVLVDFHAPILQSLGPQGIIGLSEYDFVRCRNSKLESADGCGVCFRAPDKAVASLGFGFCGALAVMALTCPNHLASGGLCEGAGADFGSRSVSNILLRNILSRTISECGPPHAPDSKHMATPGRISIVLVRAALCACESRSVGCCGPR